MEIVMTLVWVVAIIAFMYFTMIRPENKRKKALEELRNSISVGDDITTIGGIIGTVVNENTEKLVIETSSDRVRLEIARWAVSSKNVKDEEAKDDKKEDK